MLSSRQHIEEEDICLAVPEEQSLERQGILQQAALMAAEAEGSLLNHRQEAESKLQMTKSLNNSPFLWHTSYKATLSEPLCSNAQDYRGQSHSSCHIQKVRPFDKWDLMKLKRFLPQ